MALALDANPSGLLPDGTFTIWLYSFISVILASFLGMVPIICMPRLQNSRHKNDLLQFLIGLAIGTLTADALLHLLPISSRRQAHAGSGSNDSLAISNQLQTNNQPTLGATRADPDDHYQHNQHAGVHDDHHSHLHIHADFSHNGHTHPTEEGFWFGFMALVGIVGFLVIERIMLLLTDLFTHSAHHQVVSADDSLTVNDETSQTNQLKANSAPLALQMTSQVVICRQGDQHHQDHHNHPHMPKLHSHENHHQHQHHHLTNETKSFMFMIITGDGLHNFFDGIAIGVSYGSSVAVGLSTTIAILCHELPHEIGDFAVLIKAGMSIRRALLYNALSSILCLLGATTGVFIGKIDVGWVSALIAGMFLYISLVDMVPLLDCYPNQRAFKRIKKLLIQLAGISAGVVIMSLIAKYESKFHYMIDNWSWSMPLTARPIISDGQSAPIARAQH